MSSTSTGTASDGGFRFTEVFPFVALPLLILVSFLCPPFTGRGVVFSALIILANYGCIGSTWPPDTSDTRPMRYGMTGSWLFVLPAVERLLLHQPEKDFWCVDQEKKPQNGRPREWSLQKLAWAFSLVSSPRAVGWNFASHKINAAREAVRASRISRGAFIAKKLIRAIIAYVALDGVVLLAKQATIPRSWEWNPATVIKISFVECLMAISVWSTMSLQFEISAGISVGFGLSRPQDWPPLFGSISECYTIANVWGKFWHSYIRQPVLGFSRAIVQILGIHKRSVPAYTIHLTTAFAISAFFHTLSLFVVSHGYIPIKNLVLDMAVFFMSQPLATILESLVITQSQVYMQKVKRNNNSTAENGQGDLALFSPRLRVCTRLIGYLWVIFWFTLTGWWFVQPYVAIGVLNWPLPFSFWGILGLQPAELST